MADGTNESSAKKQLGELIIEVNFSRLNPNAKPSRVHEANWLYAFNKKRNYPKSTSRNGKWLVFGKGEYIDSMWAKIKENTEEGKLGSSSKVSTAAQMESDKDKLVICIYTYDCEDKKDVRRIREELRGFGITGEIPYKTDEATRKSIYATGHGRISKYYG